MLCARYTHHVRYTPNLPYRVPIYQIKAHETLFKVQTKRFCFDKKIVLGNTLTLE